MITFFTHTFIPEMENSNIIPLLLFLFMAFYAGINENDTYDTIYTQYKLEAEKT